MATIHHWTLPMDHTDKALYEAMGKRIASARKELGLTQVQLAQVIGVSQQTLAHYEVGRLRIAISTLHLLAQTLDVNIEALINEQKKQVTGKRGPTPRLLRQVEQIGQLPRTKQKFVMEMLDAVIQQQAS